MKSEADRHWHSSTCLCSVTQVCLTLCNPLRLPFLAWRIPGTGEPGGLLSLGSHRVRHDWSALAAAYMNYRNFWYDFHCYSFTFSRMSYVTPYVTFWVWLLSLRTMRLIHVVECSCGSFFWLLCSIYPFMNVTKLLIHSPVDEHLGCFQFGADRNTAATNICI